MDISLSDKDVLTLVEQKANLVLYSEIPDYDTLNKLLGKNGACFILYEWKKDYGHWTCIFKGKSSVEFFDPYGTYIDDELNMVPMNFREESNQDYPHLTQLLYDSGYDVTYNEHQFQKKGQGINTCGRWCALRLAFKDMSLAAFVKLFKSAKGDDLVSYLTSFDLDY